ncbi:hypothetical protein [Methylobacterium sp. WL120]|uniref:hypothetical protein n=1 Tax=Methylobacterium sp. WL120 TaxID=2603887 RepID=UPI0011C97FC2|nr:hypothetical protein [Methylobacterium sp. WL120]TXM69605.1 hypothetical protein FV229_04485 [Methylobacterium sp. WL120]
MATAVAVAARIEEHHMIWAFIARTPDILQFIGLIAVLGLMGMGMWKFINLFNRLTGRGRRR